MYTSNLLFMAVSATTLLAAPILPPPRVLSANPRIMADDANKHTIPTKLVDMANNKMTPAAVLATPASSSDPSVEQINPAQPVLSSPDFWSSVLTQTALKRDLAASPDDAAKAPVPLDAENAHLIEPTVIVSLFDTPGPVIPDVMPPTIQQPAMDADQTVAMNQEQASPAGMDEFPQLPAIKGSRHVPNFLALGPVVFVDSRGEIKPGKLPVEGLRADEVRPVVQRVDKRQFLRSPELEWDKEFREATVQVST